MEELKVERKHSCLDRKFWYHNACAPLEWKEPLTSYRCPEFQKPANLSLGDTKNLSIASLMKQAKALGIPTTEDRNYLAHEVFYRPMLKALDKYVKVNSI